MGDRANIAIKQHGGGHVYLYTHWGGYDLPDILKASLKRGKDRWGDEQYLARIIFCGMVNDDSQGTTGYGISNSIGDNEHDILVIDCDKLTVSQCEYDTLDKPKKTWKFSKYIKLRNGTPVI